MLDIPLEKIVEKIVKDASLSKEQVHKLINDKKEELHGLVSDEGAAFIVANEKGVSFLPSTPDEVSKISSIVGGMKFVNVVGRVVACYPVNEFESKGRKGAVASFLFGDDSGVTRVVVWNELTRLISEERISPGDILKINGAYSRSNRDRVEVHLSSTSRLAINPEGVSAPELSSFPQARGTGSDSLLGAVTYIYPQVRFFDVCPDCNKRLENDKCGAHGLVRPKKSMVLSLNLDNGTNVYRVILFGSTASNLLSKSVEALFSDHEADESFKENLTSLRKILLGRIIQVSGRMQTNDFTNREEIIVRNIDLQPDPTVIAKSLA